MSKKIFKPRDPLMWQAMRATKIELNTENVALVQSYIQQAESLGLLSVVKDVSDELDLLVQKAANNFPWIEKELHRRFKHVAKEGAFLNPR